jgi:filamentous hemagglutinin family protein
MKASSRSRLSRLSWALALIISETFGAKPAMAQPDAGVVTAGAATISQAGNVLNVHQSTDRAVINWNSFSVPNGHTANFNLPSANSAVLNRVTSLNNPSLINGAINSNGNVFLVNPSGVVIGSTGVINTAGFTASALDIPNHEFMQGGTLHFRGESKASVINNGTINAGAGGVTLVGHTVINTGTITSQGSVNMVSGGSVKLSNGGTYTQADLATINNGISETAGMINNSGTIRAVGAVSSGGEVYLVNPNGKILNSGVIRASRETTVAATSTTPATTQTVGGQVVIQAKTDKVELAGKIDVSGDVGGKVVVTGKEVQLASATIDASGTNGGGTVNLGGGYQGKDPAIQNAQKTTVDANSTVSVNAATGNAGTVIVWSDQATIMDGSILAQSTVSGNGGFVEISSAGGLKYQGEVLRQATNGNSGLLLLDPDNIYVGTFSSDDAQLNNNTILVGDSPGASFDISVTKLITELGTGNVTLQAAKFISFYSGNTNYNSANDLTIMSGGDIQFFASLQNAGAGDINIVAGWNKTTAFNASTFSNANPATTTIYGNTITDNTGTINFALNQSAVNNSGVAIGSAKGLTRIYANNLYMFGAGSNRTYNQIGYHHASGGTVGSTIATGGIVVRAKGAVYMEAGPTGSSGSNSPSFVQIGHGGWRSTNTDFNYTGNIDIKSDSLNIIGSNGTATYAQIGHGGFNSDGDHSGTITIVNNFSYIIGGDGTSAFAQIGHGGQNVAGNISGTINITQTASGDFQLFKGGGTNAYAQIGHGGAGSSANVSNSDINLDLGYYATFSGSRVGHRTSGTRTGDTFIGVKNNTSVSFDGLYADASTVFTSGTGGELRLYLPTRAFYQLDTTTTLNGVAAVAPGTTPLPNEIGFYTFGNGPSPSAVVTRPYGIYLGAASSIRVTGTGGSVYGDPITGVSYSLVSGTLWANDTIGSIGLTNNLTVTNNSNAASYVFNISLSNTQYSLQSSTGTYTISRAPLSVSALNQSKLYGETFVFNNTHYSVVGLKNNQTVGNVTLTSAGTAAGATVVGSPYVITPSNATGGTFNPANYTISYSTGLLTVNPAILELSIKADNRTKVYGDSSFSLGTIAFTTQGLMSGDSVDSVTLTSLGEAVTANVGLYTIVASAATGTNLSNYSITYIDGQLQVTPRDITVTALGGTSTYGQNPVNPGLSATNLASFDTVAALTGLSNSFGIDQYTNAGPHTLTVAGTLTNGNYNVTQAVNGTWTVDPAALSISALAQSKTYGETFVFAGTEFTPTGLQNMETIGSVTLSSPGAVNTANVALSPYVISASDATGGTFNPNNYTINYTAAEMNVIARNITVTALGGTSTYGQNPVNPGLSATNLANFDTVAALTGLSNSFGIDQYTNAGPHTLTVAGTLTNGNYNVIQTVNGTWTVDPAALSIGALDQTKTYGETFTFDDTHYSINGLQNMETIGSVTIDSLGAVNTATVTGSPYAINISNATGGTFNPNNYTISYTAAGMNVIARDITVTALGGTSTYGQNPVNPGLSATNLASFDSVAALTGLSNSFGIDQHTNAGPHTLTVAGTLTNTNYSVTDRIDGTWNVDKASLTITANSRNKTYGQTLNLGTTQFTPVGLQNMETIGSVTLTSAGAAGSATVAGSPYAINTSNATGGTFNPNNYEITYSAAGLLTVDRANLTVRANNRSKTYGDNLNLGTTAFTRTGTLFNGNTLTNVTLVASGTPAGNLATADAGTYSITPSNAVGTGLDNYNITYVNGTLNVGRANLFITPTGQTKVYGDSFTFAGTEFNSSGLKNGDTIASVTLVSAGTAPTANAGLYSITASNAVGGTYKASNYNTFYIPNLIGFTVTRAPLTVTIQNANKVYGDVKTFNGTEFSVGAGQLKNSDTLTNVTILSAGQLALAPVDDYTIIGTIPVQGNINLLNYNITVNPGTLSVTPAPLTITANDQTKIYGNSFSFIGNEFVAVGLKNNQSITSVNLSSAATAPTATVAGSPYDIDISNAQGSGFNPNNYSITYVQGNFEVTQRALTITANNQNKIFGTNHNLGSTAFTTGSGVNQGLVNGDTVTNVTLNSTGTPAAAPVGNYPIVASNAVGSGLNNYNITYTNGTLHVAQANLILVANNQYKTFGWLGLLNGVTGYTAFGLQNSDTIGSVSLSSLATPYNAPIGFYPISISNPTGGTANLSNYNITLIPGLFVVGSNLGNYTHDVHDRAMYYWQTLPWLYNQPGVSQGINYSPAGQTTENNPLIEINSYDVFGGDQE